MNREERERLKGGLKRPRSKLGVWVPLTKQSQLVVGRLVRNQSLGWEPGPITNFSLDGLFYWGGYSRWRLNWSEVVCEIFISKE